MKRPVLILAAMFGLASAAAAETIKVGIGAEPYAPFTSPDASGVWVGWEIDLINAVCKAADLECVITPIAWEGIIPALTGGQIDVIMNSMSITEERLQTVDFSDKYYNTPTIILAAKGVVATPDAAGLAGKILGVQVSTTHENYAQAHFKDTAAEIKIYQTADEALQDLTAGRIDATQTDVVAADVFLLTEAGAACCEIVGAVADDPVILGRGVGVAIRKGDTGMLAKFNAAIAKVREDGTYDAITKNYFASSIYGD